MRHISTTTARSPRADGSPARVADEGPRKWDLLDQLAEAREAFGLKPAQLAVLRVLLSFYPEDRLPRRSPAVIFPSNRVLSERLHGMPESTLRRHLARLVVAGAIERRDSPNRKRFVIRGEAPLPFGFDLAPLAALASQISAVAERARREAECARGIRMRIRLLLVQLAEAGAAPSVLAEGARVLRRRLAADALDAIAAGLRKLAEALASNLVVAAAQNERPQEPEERPRQESDETTEDARGRDHASEDEPRRAENKQSARDLTLEDAWACCRKMEDYREPRDGNWNGFAECGHRAGRALGISAETWRWAAGRRSAIWAAGLVGLMLRHAERIARPDAYFRALVGRAEQGRFDLVSALRRGRS